MWFLGLIVGAVIGGAFADGAGALLGAIAGTALVVVLRRPPADPKLDERLRALEARVARLAHTLDLLQSRPPATSTEAAPVAPEVVASVPAASLTPAEQFAREAAAAPTTPGEAAAAVAHAAVAEPTVPVDPYVVPPPAEDEFDRFFARVRGWLFGGNTVVRVGVVVLFFGVAFLLKFAYDQGMMPPELRVGGAAVAGLVLALIGWRLRESREAYALTLQGAGVGVLYLSIFAALRLYDMLPPPLAFALLAGLSLTSVVLALYQNSQSLAVLAVSGGFLAPILTSTGSGNHVALFSYYAVIDAGIVWLASRKAWRPLNLAGFFFTFGVAAAWGARYFQPELWSTAQPFLVLFFLMFLAIPALFAREALNRTDKYLDGTLVFGLPVVATGLQSRLVADFEYGGAISAIVASVVYVFAATLVRRRHGATLALLTQSFAALGVMFATLAIPLALDARWTSAAWALEGAAVAWVGLRQGRWLPRLAGCVLQLAAGVAFLGGLQDTSEAIAVFNRDGLGFLFLALAAFFTAFQFERNAAAVQAWERPLRWLALAVGLGWWYAGGLHEIELHAELAWRPQLLLAFFVASSVGFEAIGSRVSWEGGRLPALAVMPLALVAFAWQAVEGRHPFEYLGYVAWPAAFAVHLWVLRRREDATVRGDDWLHAAGLWAFAMVLGWEAWWVARQWTEPGSEWSLAAWMAAPAAIIAWLSTRGPYLEWPVAARLRGYLVIGALPVVLGLLFWLIAASFLGKGGAAPLPYVPILNPLDLAVIATLFAGMLWLKSLSLHELDDWIAARPWLRLGVPGAAAFIAANGMLIRALHQYTGVAVRFETLMHSMVVQSALSLFWTVLALVLMILANRVGKRLLWLVGASLLGATVVKLFLVDLSNVAGAERIVSFVGVGVLMLVVGYFAPVPPRAEAAR